MHSQILVRVPLGTEMRLRKYWSETQSHTLPYTVKTSGHFLSHWDLDHIEMVTRDEKLLIALLVVS